MGKLLFVATVAMGIIGGTSAGGVIHAQFSAALAALPF